MRIYEDNNPDFGKAFKRISDALRKHCPPNTEWVNKDQDPDITIIHVVGGEEFEKLLKMDLSKTVIVQHCVYTTDIPTDSWQPFWKDAKAVISWNYLENVMPKSANFVRIPWGADSSQFKRVPDINKNIKVFSTGHVASTEMLDSVHKACEETGNVLYHTGENFRWNSNSYKFMNYMNDREFTSVISRAQYVTGLRLMEGFEMMCIEGAMTGAIPIVPDLPSYDWYKNFGIFIDTSNDVVGQLKNVFSSKFVGLSDSQVEYVRNRFSWETVCKEFFEAFV